MKSTGIIRKLDTLGRYVIPKEIRAQLDIKENVDFLEVFIDNDNIILRKHEASCRFCGAKENLCNFKDDTICGDCIKEIKQNF